jgi:hypothetical protein
MKSAGSAGGAGGTGEQGNRGTIGAHVLLACKQEWGAERLSPATDSGGAERCRRHAGRGVLQSREATAAKERGEVILIHRTQLRHGVGRVIFLREFWASG